MAMSCQEKNLMTTTDLPLQPDAPDRWERAADRFLTACNHQRPHGGLGGAVPTSRL